MTAPTKRDGEQVQRNRFTRRTLLLGASGMGLFGLLASKLYNLQNIEGRKYKSLAEDNRITTRFLPPVRGKIYDRNHMLIATNAQNLRVLIIPERAKNVARSLSLLGQVIKISDRQKRRVLKTARRQNPQFPILVADNILWGQFARINVLGERIPGIIGDISWKRRYELGEEFAHILGHLGQPSSFQLTSQPALHLPGALVGVAGVEQGFESALHGMPGRRELEVNARGQSQRVISETPAQSGKDIILTIDHVLQQRILKRLSPYRRAAVVAIEVNSGDIVAMCSTPSFDPNILTPPIDKNEWKNLLKTRDQPLEDKATRGQYPPGSTFKMVTALAGLEAGIITARTRFKCPGYMQWHKQRYNCWKHSGHGSVQLHKALKQSCDVFFYETARKIGIHRLAAMARKLGLGEVYDCGLPGQKPGIVPDPDWKQLEKRRIWFRGETVLAAIGQGYVLATPLQLAVMTARLATGRKILPRIAYEKGKELRTVAPLLGLSKKSLKLIHKGMSGVINEQDGTATGAALGWPGLQMAGKTGTSQVRGNRWKNRHGKQLDWQYRDHALFVAFAPVKNPRYAVSVIVEHGKSGGKVAGPVARDIMKMLLIRDPAHQVSSINSDHSSSIGSALETGTKNQKEL
ncbi:MAG: penicillin-binding protein 2 [Hyphomicrobiaceae bacterium]|nr:penicillin-binding protein 2 [Hyphomicrobiaceae bacterium]